MNWRIKGVTQKVLSTVPGGTRINDCLQRACGMRDFEAHVRSKVRDDWFVFMSHMAELGISPSGLHYLEVGTGWFPTLPICYSLCGAASCATFDVVRHLIPRLTFRMLAVIERDLPQIAECGLQKIDDVRDRYARINAESSWDQLFERAGIKYHAPADAARTPLSSESIDVVFSNSVLEHVAREDIVRLMGETKRILRHGGWAIHSVNCGDHYAYFDRKITPINYLRYSEHRWRFWNNSLQYQNRLRPQDFIDLAEEVGLEIVLRKNKPRNDLLGVLPEMTVAREFQHYPPEELCCTSIDFVARKP